MRRLHKGNLINLNRTLAWVLALFATAMAFTGYGNTRGFFDRYFMQELHLVFEWGFLILFVIHVSISIAFLRYSWRGRIKQITQGKASPLQWLRFIQRSSAWLLLVSAAFVIFSGWTRYYEPLALLLPFQIHIQYEVYLLIFITIHAMSSIGVALSRKGLVGWDVNFTLFSGTTLIFVLLIAVNFSSLFPSASTNSPGSSQPIAQVTIGNAVYEFNPSEVNTTRPDLFKPNTFSIFDVLVHLSLKGDIDLVYTFNTSLNTHIIDSINSEPNWWYYVWYSGGWQENSVFRPDHYPWKESTTLIFYQENPERLEKIYETYQDEITRFQQNDQKVIIPLVIISGQVPTVIYENVTVTPHNLRNDSLQDDVVTAIDIIMSLGDQGRLNYTLKWYDSIGGASIVRSYWVEAINTSVAYGGCGFVYEAGSHKFPRFAGNHIHLPSDMRILNSPEYSEWFWICL